MKVVAFNGSPRPDGNTHFLIEELAKGLRSRGITVEEIHVGGKAIRGCTVCLSCKEKKDGRCAIDSDPVNSWIARMVEADGIILGSPSYFADLTPELKALIDRAGFVARTGGGLLRWKAGAAVVSMRRAGACHTFDSINHFFLASQMVVVGSNALNIGLGGEKGAVLQDAEGMANLRVLGENMAMLLEKLHCSP
jgi:multimeric flavodoxin WrbA